MKNLDDGILITKILEDDPDAFSELVRRYWPMAYQLCFQRLRNNAEAEDIAQEAFIKVHKYLKQLKDKTKFTGWFYQLVFQLIIERSREQKYRKTQPIKLELEEKPSINTMSKLFVRDAMNSLSDDFRLILTLRFYKDMSCEEIAQHLREPVGTITSRLHRAYQLLKEKLK
ncbi:MAG: sigma-70 family RNA polymerase sigma factor [Planctomycetota bacterium]